MKSNYSLVLAYICAILLFYSGFCDGIVVNGNGTMMYTISGFSLTIIGYINYIYGLTTNKKKVYITGYIITIVGYICSIAILLAANNLTEQMVEIDNIAVYTSRLGAGAYLNIISAIPLVISIFLPKNNKKIENNTNNPESKLSKEINNIQNDNYIFCKYIYGIKELNSNSQGVIRINNNNTLSLIVINNENNPQEITINCNDIKDINVRSSVVFTEEQKQTEDHTMANTTLATVIFGAGLTSYAASSFMNQAESYSKLKEKVIYEINITLLNGNIMIQTKNNPQEFISKINIVK